VVFSLSLHCASGIRIQRGAKFGGTLPQPFICLADWTRMMWHEFMDFAPKSDPP